jgi:UDP-N-acetylmuramate dehydrogenase
VKPIRADVLERVAAGLQEGFRGKVARDYPLAPLTTYRLGGPADLYVAPIGAPDVVLLGRVLKEQAVDPNEVPILTLGRGSNLVVSDEGIPGVVIRLAPAESVAAAPEGSGPRTRVTAGASTPLPQLANWAARRTLTGVEFAVAIPGSVGGGVRMNAGAYGRTIADVLASAHVFDLDALELERRDRRDLGLSYRRSDLTARHLVVDADFVLDPGDEVAIRERMSLYRRHRAETQPGGAQNAGSVFKNPDGDSAGRLIEAAGLKGATQGGVAVSELHANFFVAGRGARAQDVCNLVRHVREVVLERFGITLEPEIRFVGRFDGDDVCVSQDALAPGAPTAPSEAER